MAKRVNAKLTLYTVTTDWQGRETEEAHGPYDVWDERHTVYGFNGLGKGGKAVISVARGIVFVWDNLPVSIHDRIDIGGKSFSVVGIDIYNDGRGNFHHMELAYA